MCIRDRCSPPVGSEVTVGMELDVVLTAKIHVVSGMVIGALAVMAAKQMCKQRKTRKHSTAPDQIET